MMKKQNETKPHENPAVLAKDFETKQNKIDRELVYLLNKAKYYVPKPKVNETGKYTQTFYLEVAFVEILKAKLAISFYL
jgi:hypothetical protein